MWLVPVKSYYKRLYVKTLFKLLDLLKSIEKYKQIIESIKDYSLSIEKNIIKNAQELAVGDNIELQ